MTSDREAERLAVVRALDLPTLDPVDLDGLAALAAHVAGTPTALVNVVTDTAQRSIAGVGEGCDVPREVGFCDRVVRSEHELHVPDARQDARFADNPLVTADPPLVFYAGFPLRVDGALVGTLCVADEQPHALDERQRTSLRTLARQVGLLLELRRRRREQQQRHDLVEAVLETVDVGIVACDADGRLTLFNPATERMHGLPVDAGLDPEQWAGRFDLYDLDGTTLLPADRVPLARALRGLPVRGEDIVIAPRGLPARRVRCEGRALRDADGKVAGAVVAMVDVTRAHADSERLAAAHDALRRSADELARREEEFRTAFEAGPLAMCRVDAEGVVVQANPAFRRLLALRSGAVLGRTLEGLCRPEHAAEVQRLLLAAGTTRSPGWAEVRMTRADGSALWCELAVSRIVDADGEPAVLVQLADVDARRRREGSLRQQVEQDALTGLASRTALVARLAEELARPDEQEPVAVLLLDLDGFKAVNDSAGHATGDAVLVEVGRRLQSAVREGDLVARLGGDEFVVVTRAAGGALTALTARLQDVVARPYVLDGTAHRVGASVGAVLAGPGDDVDSVLAEADRRMYGVKRAVPSQR